MGNNHSSSIVTRNAGALDTFVSELGPDVIYDKRYANETIEMSGRYSWQDSLGNSRFLKTVRCRHKNGYIVAKIYIKPEDDELDEKYMRRLRSTSYSCACVLFPELISYMQKRKKYCKMFPMSTRTA